MGRNSYRDPQLLLPSKKIRFLLFHYGLKGTEKSIRSPQLEEPKRHKKTGIHTEPQHHLSALGQPSKKILFP